MKLISKSEASNVYLNDDEITVSKKFKRDKDFQHEKEILKKLKENDICNHSQIITYDNVNKTIKLIYIPFNLEEMCGKVENSSKFQIIDSNILIYKILMILESLHKHEIVHGDFKAKNIQLNISNKPFIIDYDLTVIKFKSRENMLELMNDDLYKMKLLIIQLQNNLDYKSTYTNVKKHIKNINRTSPLLSQLLENKKYNISLLLEYFKMKSNQNEI